MWVEEMATLDLYCVVALSRADIAVTGRPAKKKEGKSRPYWWMGTVFQFAKSKQFWRWIALISAQKRDCSWAWDFKDGPNATGLGISKMANMRLCYAYFHQVKSVLFHFSHLEEKLSNGGDVEYTGKRSWQMGTETDTACLVEKL